jgi:hypothetical protein
VWLGPYHSFLTVSARWSVLNVVSPLVRCFREVVAASVLGQERCWCWCCGGVRAAAAAVVLVLVLVQQRLGVLLCGGGGSGGDG